MTPDKLFLTFAAAASLAISQAQAEPKVVADIPPIHALVAQVMKDVGEPELLIDGRVSPHNFTLRPSQASSLADADAVFWIGPTLSPGLEKPISSLAGDAEILSLIELDTLKHLEVREGALFEAHDHGDDDHHDDAHHGEDEHDDHKGEVKHDHDHDHEEHHDEAKHDDAHHGDEHHDEHAHGEEHDGEEHHGEAHAEGDHDDHHSGHHDDHHAHGGRDPHIWLNPDNAQIMLTAVADLLTKIDPANAAAYQTNAARARGEIAALSDELESKLSPLAGQTFFVFHDAYQHLETRYGVEATGAIALPHAGGVSPARLETVRNRLLDAGAACVFSEPQFDADVVQSLVSGTGAKVGELDPLGQGIPPGPGQYALLLTSLSGAMADCLR